MQRATETPLVPSAETMPPLSFDSESSPIGSPLSSESLAHVPYKYSSIESCEKATRKCSGHGDCKVIGSTMDGATKEDVYGCVCTPSVRTNKDGSKKTTHWGGAACQKKDVVGPFWLLAGTTIFLISILTMGIGMLYSMSSEELPSVIGAGVTGPRAK